MDIVDYMENDKSIIPKLSKKLIVYMKLYYIEHIDIKKQMKGLYDNLIMLGYPKELLDLKIKLYKEKYLNEASLNKELESLNVFPGCKEL